MKKVPLDSVIEALRWEAYAVQVNGELAFASLGETGDDLFFSALLETADNWYEFSREENGEELDVDNGTIFLTSTCGRRCEVKLLKLMEFE